MNGRSATINEESRCIPATKLTLGQADFLVGKIYHKCKHTTRWILHYKLVNIESGDCARCRAPGTFACPVCRHVHKGKGAGCPGCNSHFHDESALKERRAELEARGLKVVDMTARIMSKYLVEKQKKEQEKACANYLALRAAQWASGSLSMPEAEEEEED